MSMTTQDCKPRKGYPRPVPDIPDNVLAQFSLRGKVAIVTGAAAGIGFSVAEGFAEAGADVVLWYNSNDEAVAKSKELEMKHGIKTKAMRVNVKSLDPIKEAVDSVVKEFGKVDIFVANSGTAVSKPVLGTSLDEYHDILDVNVHGVVYSAMAIGPIFKRQGFGNLIITASMSGKIVNVPEDQPVYNATKAFVAHFAKSVAREWREFARVNAVSPGYFDTKMGGQGEKLYEACRMTPLGRQGDVKEIKALYLYLASNASTYVTGSDVLIDGGYTLP